jgi:hypothetical protein
VLKYRGDQIARRNHATCPATKLHRRYFFFFVVAFFLVVFLAAFFFAIGDITSFLMPTNVRIAKIRVNAFLKKCHGSLVTGHSQQLVVRPLLTSDK